MISKPQGAPFACWVTGWFNLLGQVAGATGISFACANFISTATVIYMDYKLNSYKTIGIYAAVLIAQGTISTFGVHILKYLNNVSVWWHALGTTLPLLFSLQPRSDDRVGWSQRASPAYVAVIGILLAHYALTGFDASAHMAKETHNAARSGPIGIITAIGVSAILGWFLILSLLFSIQDYGTTVASPAG
ncbi:amino acid/polyamine transporter I [Russula aff. rugulosa BPL654]|nr:amino acid/polyamine transporter I [Russula aff. rugulosa BPL654]